MASSVFHAAGALLVITLAACVNDGAAQSSGPWVTRRPSPNSHPRRFEAAFDTSKGRFVVDVHREWAPIGADRFYNLVKSGFFDDVRFFRVIGGQLAQFGMHGDPRVQDAWRDAVVQDDPVKHSNTRGTVSFASRGPNTRTTQLFINLTEQPRLRPPGLRAVCGSRHRSWTSWTACMPATRSVPNRASSMKKATPI